MNSFMPQICFIFKGKSKVYPKFLDKIVKITAIYILIYILITLKVIFVCLIHVVYL